MLYFAHGLSQAILLFIIAIICYHYAKHKSKEKDIDTLTFIKMKRNELKNIFIKSRTCCYFDDKMTFEDLILVIIY